MVDVSGKDETLRRARAAARLRFPRAAFERLLEEGSPKGDLFATARVAGILAAKRVAELIPLCHPLPLSHVAIDFRLEPPDALLVECAAAARAPTGVEMEALVGTALAALTVYDMCKALDPAIAVESLRVVEKSGGTAGKWPGGGAASA